MKISTNKGIYGYERRHRLANSDAVNVSFTFVFPRYTEASWEMFLPRTHKQRTFFKAFLSPLTNLSSFLPAASLVISVIC